MNTSTGLYLCLCGGNASDRIAASLPLLPESVRPSRGSGNSAPDIQATSPHSVLQNHGGTPPQQQPDDPSWETTLLGTDQRRTVLHKRAAQDQADRVYTPYGHSQDTGGLGFNGERRESVTGHYLLGAGYRAFNPVLMRFNNPDSLSPFEGGGLNPYAYCVGDPVNFVDPTGHLPSWAMMAIGIAGGIALGVVSGGVGTLVAGSMAASTAAAVGNASMVLGVGLELASAGTGIAGMAMGGEKGDLLGKISMGLGLAAGAVGGFGGGMRMGAMSRAANGEPLTLSYRARLEAGPASNNAGLDMSINNPANVPASVATGSIPSEGSVISFPSTQPRLSEISNTSSISVRSPPPRPQFKTIRVSESYEVSNMNRQLGELNRWFAILKLHNPYARTMVINTHGLIRHRLNGGLLGWNGG